ncbi:MAG: ankyrin repeat domain-containing protein [Myxococcales bacterium]|nr:ankyrin repeat domain-containing protein [Myxococcales bacterium]
MSSTVAAAWRGDLERLAEHLDADPAHLDADGHVDQWDGALTPVMAASIQGQTPALLLLLDRGAQIPDDAVMQAVGGGHHEAAETLVARGAPVTARAAAGMRQATTLLALLQADPTIAREVGDGGDTPLHYAATVEAVEALLARGADLDARDSYHGNTPHQWAMCAATPRLPIAQALRERGCALDLFDAIALGDLHAVQRELDADPAALDRRAHPHDLHASGGPPLHAAIRLGQAAIVDELLQRGADVNLPGQRPLHASALHWAAFHDDARSVDLLLDRNADPSLVDAAYDSTALDWAEHNGCASAAARIRARTG